ncbi:hypothetical protein MTR_0030s0040 [Medicago truncatula]|uniref:Uncharacterized protein n=1 Tax=Medicago truncatula TaxID=3880 RepID=A0A072TJ13_MEDTR|nr:hypothetical protein MTR_0030s0040 [Medicago truncatula]
MAATEDNVAEDVTAVESNSETNEDHLEQQDAIVFDDMKYLEGSMIRTVYGLRSKEITLTGKKETKQAEEMKKGKFEDRQEHFVYH